MFLEVQFSRVTFLQFSTVKSDKDIFLGQLFQNDFFCYFKLQKKMKTADSDTASTYQVSSVQLVTDKKLEAFNKA